MLEIFLFGPFRLYDQGQPYSVAALPKTVPLLTYLLLHRTQPLLRTTLAYTLWPDVKEAAARTNLRRHLYEVRRVLPPAPPDQPWLLVDNRTVQWNSRASYRLDVDTFLTLRTNPATLADAVALYQADLLPDLDEEWIFFLREELRAHLLTDLTALVAYHEVRQEFAAALGYAQQLLFHDPMAEAMVRTLMRLRHAQGDRTGALQEYQRFAQRLRSELGVAPMLETNALYDRLSQETDVSPAPPSTVPPPTVPPSTFPPSTFPLSPHNLPAQLTSFIGREAELATLRALLSRQEEPVRLLTLTGPGGGGKTRLALEVANRLLLDQAALFPDGIFAVMLSVVLDPSLLPAMIAATLAIKEQPGVPLWESIKSALQPKQLLLLLDNFEQLLEAAPPLLDLLMAAPRLRLVVTSRALLHLYGEVEFVVPPLPLPMLDEPCPPERLAHYAAVKLFVTRSRAVNPTFTLTRENASTIAEICVRLDGLPLPLELAAARSKLFAPQELLDRLANSLTFLADRNHRVEARHQTLRATLDWSYHLLAPAEQRLFARLAIFARRFTLPAAEAICAIDGDLDVLECLTGLVNNSLVRRVADEEEMRFLLLVTVREYAWAQLTETETNAIAQQHTAYYLRFVEAAPRALYAGQQLTWLDRLRHEEDNIRAALTWALQPDAETTRVTTGARIVHALSRFWQVDGRIGEAAEWLARALALRAKLAVVLQINLLNQAGFFAQLRGAHEEALQHHESALALARTGKDDLLLAQSLHALGTAYGRQANHLRSLALLNESLALQRTLGPRQDGTLLARTMNNLAATYQNGGDPGRAVPLLEESLAYKERQGDQFGVAVALANLANIALLQEEIGRAATLFRQSLALRHTLNDQLGMTNALDQMAQIAVSQGDLARGLRLYAASDSAHRHRNTSWTAVARHEIDKNLLLLREQLGEQCFKDLWRTGTAMSLDDAVLFALGTS